MPCRRIWIGGIYPRILASALEGSEWSASRFDHLATGEDAQMPIGYGTWLIPEPIWALWRREKYLASDGN
jgi:hypothetical protein